MFWAGYAVGMGIVIVAVGGWLWIVHREDVRRELHWEADREHRFIAERLRAASLERARWARAEERARRWGGVR